MVLHRPVELARVTGNLKIHMDGYRVLPGLTHNAPENELSPRGVFLFVEQVELVSAYLLGSEFFWRPAEVLCKLLYGKNVTTGCCLGIVAALEFFQHPLTKLGHRDLLSVTLEANATRAYRKSGFRPKVSDYATTCMYYCLSFGKF
jgi:hypothetical protein